MIRLSAKIASYFAKMLIEEIEGVIDEEIEIKHCDMSKKIENMIENENMMKKIGETLKLNPQLADLCYSPVI